MKNQPANNHFQRSRALFVVGLILAIGVGFFKFTHHPMLTYYQNADGKTYKCSKSIRAKPGKATILGHSQGPIPYSQTDATKYCHNTGIE
jgi:hypothetical protein